MNDERLAIHERLCSVMKNAYILALDKDPDTRDFSKNVYYQPPSSVFIHYPAIVYEKSRIDIQNADNESYLHNYRYTVTVIDPDPDSVITELVSKLPKCRYDRHFINENLNHDSFEICY